MANNLAQTGTVTGIIEAAARLFSRFGYTRVTMEEIAAEAGLKKGSLYYYYAAKEDLFREVVETRRNEFRSRVMLILKASESASERLEDYALARFDYFKNLQALNIPDFRESSGRARVLMEMFTRHAQEELEWLTELLESGRLRGEFHVPSSRKMAELLLHVLQGLRLRFMRESENLRPDNAAFTRLRREIVMFTGVLLTGIQCGRPARPTGTSRVTTRVRGRKQR
ncbi:hypothetical protein C3F09_04680 [candidate division GN15 bacterium]|uniref:HTH tetR-type domain-containing protein n=1 Tax=candidate division GN15 bacterium TaxID=2072418 RepID=A0A855X2C4_9BACT|nr:MAG: hypothetical protein C3F09_04680 [candidate division GN15 bacterium]